MDLSMLDKGKGKKGEGDRKGKHQGQGRKRESNKVEKGKDEGRKGKGKGKVNGEATTRFDVYCLHCTAWGSHEERLLVERECQT